MSCYMCERPDTSNEHVPPKNIFPKKEDHPDGLDLRKDPILVRSCDIHNTRKSKDDEYLRMILTTNIRTNNTGKDNFRGAAVRSISYSPRLKNRILRTFKKVFLGGPDGAVSASGGLQVERDRLDHVLDCMGRALYFHEYGEKYMEGLFVLPEFLQANPSSVDAAAVNAHLQDFISNADTIFEGVELKGAHPEAFAYQIIKNENKVYIRVHFYEDCKCLICSA